MQRFFDLSGGPVNVLDTGFDSTAGDDGETWVLVHGLGASSATWMSLASRLPGRSLSIDLPGFGVSPPWAGDPLEAMVEAVTEILEGIEQPGSLIGNSMGALVAAEIASHRPELVRNLVLIAPATPLPAGSRYVGFASAFRAIKSALRNAQNSADDRVDALLDLTMVDAGRVPIDVRANLIEAAARHITHRWAWPSLVKAGVALYLRLLRRASFLEMVDRIEAPTLVLWGMDDVLVRPVAMRWLMQQRPDWTSVPMPDVGHAPMLEMPEKTLDAIIHWRANSAWRPRGKGVPRERRA